MALRKMNVAVIGLSNLFHRSWIDTGLISEMGALVNLTVYEAGSAEINSDSKSLNSFFTKKELKLVSILRNLAWITYRKKSPSFSFWLERYYFSDFKWVIRSFPFKLRMKHFLRMIWRMLQIIKTNRVSIWFVFPLKKTLFKLILNSLKPNRRIRNELSYFDLVIIHSSTNETQIPIICRSLAGLKTKTLISIENWDNLTSKQVLFVKPDFVTVMGEIDHQNAMSIHDFDSSQILPIGLPKFEILKSCSREDYELAKTINILYVGFHLPHDEVEILNLMLEILSSLETEFIYTISYRPHPNARNRLNSKKLNPRISVLDGYHRNTTNGLPALDENYLLDVLSADLVIGPPTTLIVEAMLLQTPCLIDLLDDKIHRTTSQNSSKRYLHLKQFTDEFDYLTFKSIDQFIAKILDFENAAARMCKYPALKNFAKLSNQSYVTDLIAAISPDYPED